MLGAGEDQTLAFICIHECTEEKEFLLSPIISAFSLICHYNLKIGLPSLFYV
jgi:hypothetical protein